MQLVSSPIKLTTRMMIAGAHPLAAELALMPPLDFEKGPWVAGGAARKLFRGDNLGRSDIDIFFPNQASYESFKATFLENAKGTLFDKEWVSSFICASGSVVQFVHGKFFDSLEDVMNSFDISVSMFATDGKTVMHTPEAAEDDRNEIIRIVNEQPYKSPRLRRLAKYCGNGFTPLPGVITEMLRLDDDFAQYYDDGKIGQEPTAYVEQ